MSLSFPAALPWQRLRLLFVLISLPTAFFVLSSFLFRNSPDARRSGEALIQSGTGAQAQPPSAQSYRCNAHGFVELARKFNVGLFLIVPDAHLRESLLRRRGVVPDVSFAVHKNQSLLLDRVVTSFVAQCFTLERVRTDVHPLRGLQQVLITQKHSTGISQEHTNLPSTGSYALKIHIVVFNVVANFVDRPQAKKHKPVKTSTLQNSYAYFPEISRSFLAHNLTVHEYIRFPAAIESHHVLRTRTLFGSVQIAANTAAYRLALRKSHFVQCDRASVEEYKRRYGQSVGHVDMDLVQSSRLLLRAVKNWLRTYNVTIWLASGTLLGWYRECSIIPQTGDVDVFASIDQYRPLEQLVLPKSAPFVFMYKFNKKDDGAEYAFYGYGLKLDLFFVYADEEAGFSWVGAITTETCQRYRYKYPGPRIPLCSTEFLGDLHYVPCEYAKFVQWEYGDSWRQPIAQENYNYAFAKNRYWEKVLNTEECRNSCISYRPRESPCGGIAFRTKYKP